MICTTVLGASACASQAEQCSWHQLPAAVGAVETLSAITKPDVGRSSCSGIAARCAWLPNLPGLLASQRQGGAWTALAYAGQLQEAGAIAAPSRGMCCLRFELAAVGVA